MAFALDLELPARVDAPVLTAPGPREISFGRIAGRVSAGSHRVVVTVDGERAGSARVEGLRFELRVDLPPRDAAGKRAVAFHAAPAPVVRFST